MNKESDEFKVWGEAFKLRDKHKDNPELFTDKGFNQMMEDTNSLYEKYKNEPSALHLCHAIREICNDEWRKKFKKEG